MNALTEVLPAAPNASQQLDTAHPDAKLIRLCAQHAENRRRFNAKGGNLEPEDCPLHKAFMRTFRAVRKAKPLTIEGVLAKAQVAVLEATNPDGSYDPNGIPLVGEVVQDLVRAGETMPLPQSEHADAALLARRDRLATLRERVVRHAATDYPEDEAELAEFERHGDAVLADFDAECFEIATMPPAATRAGLAFKAAAAAHQLQLADSEDQSVRMAYAVLIEIAGDAFQSTTPQHSMPAPQHPDQAREEREAMNRERALARQALEAEQEAERQSLKRIVDEARARFNKRPSPSAAELHAHFNLPPELLPQMLAEEQAAKGAAR